MSGFIYVAYDKGFPVCCGTKKQIARFWDVSVATVEFYLSPAYQRRRNNDDARTVVRVDTSELDMGEE